MKRDTLEATVQKHGSWLFMTFMVIAIIPLVAFKSEFNAPFTFALKFLSIPILAASFYVYLCKLPKYRSQTGALKGSMLTLLFAALATLMSGGYVLLANAWGPGQHETVIDGQVLDMSVSRGRSSTSYLVTVSGAGGKNTRIEVTRSEYDHLAVGQHYSQNWRVGWLGIIYR